MTRHSKNNTASAVFTYHERQRTGHGTQKRRYGKDAQLAFGICGLCLHHVKDGVATPSGFIYCRECIYESLLAQKHEISRQQTLFTLQQEKLSDKQTADRLMNEQESKAKFTKAVLGVSAREDLTEKESGSKERVMKTLASIKDTETIEEKKKQMERTSFWIPEFTPQADDLLSEPSKHTTDPLSGQILKLKHLMPLKLEWSDDSELGGIDKHILCAITKKPITHQKSILLRPSGNIILESCLKDLVLPTMSCPVSGMRLRKSDIISLVPGGSGFSAHSKVEAKRYKPNMT